MLVLAQASSVYADCNTDAVKERFSAGGWQASYGRRLWDGQTVVSVVGFFFPATAPAAAAALERFVSEQLEGASNALASAAAQAGQSAQELLMGTVSSLLSGNLEPEELRLPTLDLKVNIIRVNCEQCANVPCPTTSNPFRTCKKCINSEGYYQLAVGFRLKGSVASSDSAGGQRQQTCKHDCGRCGQSGMFGPCKKCCW